MKVNFPELRFLLYLARKPRSHLPPRLFRTPLNWSYIIKNAGRNKMIPFFSHLLGCRRCQKNVPPKALATIKQEYFALLLLKDLQEKEKKILGETLAKKKLKATLLKDYTGWGLKYPPNVFPQKGDIDIFIPREDYQAISKIMSWLGYQATEFPFPKDEFALLEKDYLKKRKKNPIFVNFHFKDALPGTNGKVNPLNQKVIDRFTTLFVHSLKKTKTGFFLPSLELNFLFLCFHFFFRDKFASLRTLFEINLIIRQFQEKMNWGEMLQLCRELELESYFLFTVKIANLVFGSPLPKQVNSRIDRKPSVKLALKLYSPFLTGLPEGPEKWLKLKKNRNLNTYRFFIKLILWQKPFFYKLGPRALILFLFSFLPTWALLKKQVKT